MVDLITLLLVRYSDGNTATYQLQFVNNGDLNGYTKAMIITMMAIIIVSQLGVCKYRMAHNVKNKSSIMENIREKIAEIITHTHKTPLEQADEILLLLSVVGRSEQLVCDSCGCHPNVIYTTSKGRFCERCKPAN